MFHIQLYTDGSCINNPGPGGWAYLLECNGFTPKSGSGCEVETTNNRMELIAVIEGLKAIKSKIAVVEVFTDSQYITKTMTGAWKRQTNLDLWQQLDVLASQWEEITWNWIKAHNGHFQNEWCDKEAGRQSRLLKQLCDRYSTVEEALNAYRQIKLQH